MLVFFLCDVDVSVAQQRIFWSTIVFWGVGLFSTVMMLFPGYSYVS